MAGNHQGKANSHVRVLKI